MAAICSTIISNFHSFSLLAYYIAFIFVNTIFQSHDWFSSQFLRLHTQQSVILCPLQFHYPASYNVNVFLRGLLCVPCHKFHGFLWFFLPSTLITFFHILCSPLIAHSLCNPRISRSPLATPKPVSHNILHSLLILFSCTLKCTISHPFPTSYLLQNFTLSAV